jgi:superoxide dismutase
LAGNPQNRRPDYLEAIFNVIDWGVASEIFARTQQGAFATA